MKTEKDIIFERNFLFIMLGVVLGLGLSVVTLGTYDNGYQIGQKDCITGKIRYELRDTTIKTDTSYKYWIKK